MRSRWLQMAMVTLALGASGCAGAGETGATGVFVNGREVGAAQATQLATVYRARLLPGRYWYDARSGAWGLEGREVMGFVMPGLDFGPLAENASQGTMPVWINGRRLNVAEVTWIQQTFGGVTPGRWWLDGRTGYYGLEGDPRPLGNLIAAMRSRQSASGGDRLWCGATACGNDDGKSGYVNLGGGVIVGYDH